MNPSSDIPQPRAMMMVSVLVLCCGWILATTAAQMSVSLATDTPAAELTTASGIVMGSSLTFGTVLLAGVFRGVRRDRAGELVAGVLFAVTMCGLLADGRLNHWDAMAAFLTLAGIELTIRSGAPWSGVLLLGMGCGCSGLCASVLILILFSPHPLRRRVIRVLAALVIGVATAVVVEQTSGRAPLEALALSGNVARTGPQNVWRLVAWWADLVMPAIVLGLLAVSQFLFDGRETENAPNVNHVDKGLAVWLTLSVVLGLIWPRVVVDHGLLFVLPVFLLIPSGWRMLGHLPFDRSQWTLSLFSTACYALPFALLWVPLRKAGELVMVALLGP